MGFNCFNYGCDIIIKLPLSDLKMYLKNFYKERDFKMV